MCNQRYSVRVFDRDDDGSLQCTGLVVTDSEDAGLDDARSLAKQHDAAALYAFNNESDGPTTVKELEVYGPERWFVEPPTAVVPDAASD